MCVQEMDFFLFAMVLATQVAVFMHQGMMSQFEPS
jgi:hypothetical protein